MKTNRPQKVYFALDKILELLEDIDSDCDFLGIGQDQRDVFDAVSEMKDAAYKAAQAEDKRGEDLINTANQICNHLQRSKRHIYSGDPYHIDLCESLGRKVPE